MAKVITFSKFFLKGHPREPQPTFFANKIFSSLVSLHPERAEEYIKYAKPFDHEEHHLDRLKYIGKHHTIRKGNRWKAGEQFSPRVWSGRPYASSMIELLPPITITHVHDFEIEIKGLTIDVLLDGKLIWQMFRYTGNIQVPLQDTVLAMIAYNDGLTLDDFKAWFKLHDHTKTQPFKGQVICWGVDYVEFLESIK